jgi:hypothetical protein
MVDWQMQLSIHDKQLDQGVRQGIMLLRLARMHESEPTLVSYLVTVAVRGVAVRGLYDVLAAGPVSPEMHTALDAELALADNPQTFVNVLKTERATAGDALEPISRSESPVLYRTFGWIVKRHYLGSMQMLDDVIVESGKPWLVFRRALKPGGTLSPLTKYGILGKLLAPAVEASVEARDRDVSQLRALRVFNALRVYAEKHEREARGLADLEMREDAAMDPVTERPLIVKRTENGWLVYGVGKNGLDDGGAVHDEMKDYGVGPKPRLPQDDAVDNHQE